MALCLGVRLHDEVLIGNELVSVVQVEEESVVLNAKGKDFLITEKERKEILPEVFVSIGIEKVKRPNQVRIAIEAPREIKINRVKRDD